MTLNSAVAHLLVVASCLWSAHGTAAAQEPARDKDPVQAARESARLALTAGDVARALQAYEQVRGKDPAHLELLRSIALTRANQLRKEADPRIRVDACATILLATADRSCIDELTKLANDSSIDVGSRFAAADALRTARVTGSDRLFDFLLSQAIDQSPSTAADSLARLSPSLSREPLKRLAADSTNADARYIAAIALSRMRGDDLIPVLRSVATDPTAGAARLPAYIGLAANGDKEGLKVLNETLPLMKGRERVEAGLALVTLKDPRADSVLSEVTRGDHELVRIDAAEALYSRQPKDATRILNDALASGNPWIRARALQAATSVGLDQSASMRRAMLDRNTSVAVAAVRAAILGANKPRQ